MENVQTCSTVWGQGNDGENAMGESNATFWGIPIDTHPSPTDTRPGHYQTTRDPFGTATQLNLTDSPGVRLRNNGPDQRSFSHTDL